ncbi:hypothetical protein [Dactylosporangium salmoneum]|uniref:hypothetical protein n=1 Tax=Dactylosporangium salmoneum TaxID=53361 RepID=UPI0031E0CAEC
MIGSPAALAGEAGVVASSAALLPAPLDGGTSAVLLIGLGVQVELGVAVVTAPVARRTLPQLSQLPEWAVV